MTKAFIVHRPTQGSFHIFTISQTQVEEMFAHAREASPAECCGLVGGRRSVARSVYRLRNIARDALNAYEAAPDELFAAQREMRARGEELLGIYHSHPRSTDPAPSATDVRLAFYPSAIYFIIGFTHDGEGVLRAFRISEKEGSWACVSLEVSEE